MRIRSVQVVQQLQKQLENQKDVLKQYEPRLRKKEKEAKELSKVPTYLPMLPTGLAGSGLFCRSRIRKFFTGAGSHFGFVSLYN